MTKLREFRGTRYTIPELAALTGMNAGTICARLRLGWTVEYATTTPTPKQRRLGVVVNFEGLKGTGAGSTAQEIPEITFSEKATAR